MEGILWHVMYLQLQNVTNLGLSEKALGSCAALRYSSSLHGAATQ